MFLKTKQMGPSDHAAMQEAPLSRVTCWVLCTLFWNQETKGLGADTVTGDGQRVITVPNLQNQQSMSCGQDFLRDIRCAICEQMTINVTIDCFDQFIMSL